MDIDKAGFDFDEFRDHSLAVAGVPDTVPAAGPCNTVSELCLWFWQFGRACRAARLRPLG